jgi:hypothetical protein
MGPEAGKLLDPWLFDMGAIRVAREKIKWCDDPSGSGVETEPRRAMGHRFLEYQDWSLAGWATICRRRDRVVIVAR